MSASRKKAPPKKVIAPVFTFFKKKKNIVTVQDLFTNPVFATQDNWQYITEKIGGRKGHDVRPNMKGNA